MKTYVNIWDNKCKSYMQGHIRPKDMVIVTDGSYMVAKNGSYVSRIQFRREPHIASDYYELLTVKQTNKRRLLTEGAKYGDSLRYLNNCVIIDANGSEFYCSVINIKRFEQ